jgi:hypothetical protein
VPLDTQNMEIKKISLKEGLSLLFAEPFIKCVAFLTFPATLSWNFWMQNGFMAHMFLLFFNSSV